MHDDSPPLFPFPPNVHGCAARAAHSTHPPTQPPPCCLQIDRRMRFRYMRFWVESGHKKAGLRVSPMLRMAMDFLDKELDQFCGFKVRLDILYRYKQPMQPLLGIFMLAC